MAKPYSDDLPQRVAHSMVEGPFGAGDGATVRGERLERGEMAAALRETDSAAARPLGGQACSGR